MSVLREENAVAFAADLGVVDLRRCRIGDKTETMSGTLGRGCGDGDGDHPDLEEVPGKMVRRVVDAHEALCHSAPLDVNRIKWSGVTKSFMGVHDTTNHFSGDFHEALCH